MDIKSLIQSIIILIKVIFGALKGRIEVIINEKPTSNVWPQTS